jgi:hypothetical protein
VWILAWPGLAHVAVISLVGGAIIREVVQTCHFEYATQHTLQKVAAKPQNHHR